jgi:hypothetical protein
VSTDPDYPVPDEPAPDEDVDEDIDVVPPDLLEAE